MKKVLVRAPSNSEDVILSFTFIHKLKEEYPEAQINIIALEENYKLYGFLPFEVNVFPFKRESDTLAGIHKYAYGLADVFNIDIFFDLEDSLKSTFMGYTFRCAERFGYDIGIKRFLINRKIPIKEGLSFEKKALDILAAHTGKDYSGIKIIGKAVSLLGGLVQPYVLVFLDRLKESEERRKILKLFFESFGEQKLIFCNEKTSDDAEYDVRESFLNKIEKRPAIEFLKDQNYKQFVQLLLMTKGVLTDEPWKAALASYFGVGAFLFTSQESRRREYENLKVSPAVFTMNGTLLQLESATEKKTTETINEAVDFIYRTFIL